MASRKIKVVRVVTAPEAVSFHMRNTLKFLYQDFEVVVVGTGVSQFENEYPQIKWVNLEIPRSISLFKDLKSAFKLYQILKFEKPDVVHSIMPKAGLVSALASFLARVPVRVHTFTGQVWANKKGVFRTVLKLLDQLVALLNTHVLTDSFSQSKFLFENGIKYYGQAIPVLGQGSLSGVDLEKFDINLMSVYRKEFRKKYGIDEKDFVFSFVGRKCADKGVFELMDAFEKIGHENEQAFLMMVGPDESDGAIEGRLSKVSELVSKRIINIGKVNKVEEFLAAADVFCLPSYREGFGTVVLEAAAFGVPTLGTKINGLIDSVVDGSTGVLIPPASTDALYGAMSMFLQDRDLSKELGRNARRKVEEFYGSDVVYRELANFYRNTQNSL